MTAPRVPLPTIVLSLVPTTWPGMKASDVCAQLCADGHNYHHKTVSRALVALADEGSLSTNGVGRGRRYIREGTP